MASRRLRLRRRWYLGGGAGQPRHRRAHGAHARLRGTPSGGGGGEGWGIWFVIFGFSVRAAMGLLSRSEEVAVLVRLKVAAGPIRREIPPEMHWAFAYEMLQRVSCSLALGPELRNAVCVFYLVQGLVLIPPWIRFLGARLGIRSGEELSLSHASPGGGAASPIFVTHPVKMGTGVQSYISYRVITKVIRLVLCSESWISRLPRFGPDSVVFSVVLFELMIFLMSIG
ncbi:hypothetical protein ZWY2020_033565 [Hordeum vulgare]|nr:hypothetical protein ZWY2020_033565 [Hordeum vulgare]